MIFCKVLRVVSLYIRADALPLLLNHSFAVAELQDKFNFNAASKVRAGRVIGRCHAALVCSIYSKDHTVAIDFEYRRYSNMVGSMTL